MKYCTNPSCPHRLRTRSLAEFIDSVVVCSDCGTQLVAADSPEQVAPRGDEGPFRRPGEAPTDSLDETSAVDRARKDRWVGTACVAGGIFLAAGFFVRRIGREDGSIKLSDLVNGLVLLYVVTWLIRAGISLRRP